MTDKYEHASGTMMHACYQCKHRGGVPGSVHSSCQHPLTKETRDNPLVALMGLMGGGLPIPVKGLDIEADLHGIRNGWFSWPVNFDSVWLTKCNGFERKQAPSGGSGKVQEDADDPAAVQT